VCRLPLGALAAVNNEYRAWIASIDGGVLLLCSFVVAVRAKIVIISLALLADVVVVASSTCRDIVLPVAVKARVFAWLKHLIKKYLIRHNKRDSI